MTDDQPQVPQPGAPDPQQPSRPAYAPRPVRPPLTREARRGATVAGSVGFVLLSIGYAMVAVPLSILLLAAVLELVRSRGGQLPNGRPLGPRGLPDVVVPQGWTVPLIVISIVGLLGMVAAILVSWRILRAHAVRHPVGVTFAGAGIAIVGSLVAQGILSGFISAITSVSGGQGNIFGPGFWIAAVLGTLVTLAISAVIGWLSWWWMAHTMRPAGA
jgi:hypothetical protein